MAGSRRPGERLGSLTGALAFFATLIASLSLATADTEVLLDPSDQSVVVRGLAPGTTQALRNASANWSRSDWTALLRVSVASTNTVATHGEDLPAIAGRYMVDGEVVRFRPMFPFDPGRDYLAVFDPGQLPDGVPGEAIRHRFGLPRKELTPSTTVTALYPTTEILPENQLKLYIHFSAPMSGGDGLPFVKLLDASGSEVREAFLPLGDQFWDREHRRYTVFFDPGRVKQGITPNEELGRAIREGQSYTLRIEPEWRDAKGAPLAQAFEKHFRVAAADTRALDPSGWELAVPNASTREALTLKLDEPLDHGLLQRALGVSLVTPSSPEPIEGGIEIAENETVWRFTPSAAWKPGRYQLMVLTILEDLAGNQIGKAFEVDVFERIEESGAQEAAHYIPFVITESSSQP